MSTNLFIGLVFITAIATPTFASYGCLDDKGNGVAWWFSYKLPNGYSIAYTDAHSSSTTKALSLKSYDLDDSAGRPALIRTLRALLYNDHDIRNPFMMWNDQPDNASPSSDYGHTKGVLGVAGSRSFWLLHSTPNFPSSDGRSNFSFPEEEIKYGQTFLCVSIDSASIDSVVAPHLALTRPYIYKNTLSNDDLSDYPNLADVIAGNHVKPAGSAVKSFSVGGVSFTAMAKNAAWADDLYEGLVSPSLNVDLVVESWIRGSAEGPYCKPNYTYQVVDVEELYALDTDGSRVTWTEGQDHAKWAVDLSGRTLCVSDINRMTTQRKRGGGCICFQDESLNSQLKASISSFSDACNN